jgi:hypothetical protein
MHFIPLCEQSASVRHSQACRLQIGAGEMHARQEAENRGARGLTL